MLKQALISICAVFSLTGMAALPNTEKTFQPFTGKVLGSKVRLRTGPDLDSLVVRQLKKEEMLLVVGENNNFYAIEAPEDIKAYVYRTYVIGDMVEADHVNMRLLPNTEAPIIGQLNAKTKIEGKLCNNNKWLEFPAPKTVRFFVAKEYISHVGDANYLAEVQKRHDEAQKLINSAHYLAQAEIKKPYNEMVLDEANSKFETVLNNYADFSEFAKQAKEGLAMLQDNYLRKKITYLENKTGLPQNEKEAILKQISNLAESAKNSTAAPKTGFLFAGKNMTEKMRIWLPLEETLFASWNNFHPNKDAADFYNEQNVNAISISGVIVPYNTAHKNRPGDFLLKRDNLPVAFIYSTLIDLEKYQAKEITLRVSSRPNNNFAFPAYFVNAIE